MGKGSASRGLRNPWMRFTYNWLSQWCDPLRVVNGFRGLVWFLEDWRSYRRLPGAEPMRLLDAWPQLHDRVGTTPVDPHYFYANGWAARRILATQPKQHVDVGSMAMFVNLLAAVVPVTFVDYRPLTASLAGLQPVAASLLRLPFADQSLASISCLHVAEHVGLGRYGDPLNPDGTRLAAQELLRVLAPGGSLFFAVPVGRPRLRFNGCRILAAEAIREYFSGLELVEFAGVDDDGRFTERATTRAFDQCDYACGMFWLRRICSDKG